MPFVPRRFRLRPCPPSFLAGFCFLSAPEGRLGAVRLGTQGLREMTRSPSGARKFRRTSYEEFSK